MPAMTLKRLVLCILLVAPVASLALAPMPTTEVSLFLSHPDGTFPSAMPGAFARVTSTSSTNPWVVGTVWRATYEPETGRAYWRLPQNCQARIQVPTAGIDGTYSFGTELAYILNDMLASSPPAAPGWAGPLAPFLPVPPKGTLMVSTGTAWAQLPAGTDGYFLAPASLTATGLAWTEPDWLGRWGGIVYGGLSPEMPFIYDLGGPTRNWRIIYANSLRLATDNGNVSNVRLSDDKGVQRVILDGGAGTVVCDGVSVAGQVGNVPGISSGTAAPDSTPLKVGDVYVDVSAKKLYFATGTASSADWTIAN